MVAERLLDIFSLMASHDAGGGQPPSLCSVAAEITGLDGAGISLSSESEELTSLCISNDMARVLMDLELVLGEGPGIDASMGGIAVDEADLFDTDETRWVAYAPQAAAAGARAVFGFPVRMGAVRFGALSLFRESPGPLSEDQASDAYLMASVIGRALLTMQAGSPSGDLAQELRGQSGLDFRVHQAAGMVAVQGSISVKEALVLIRAHAYATQSELVQLARAIVTRATRFDPLTDDWVEDEGQSEPPWR
jgi:hypothetical protein